MPFEDKEGCLNIWRFHFWHFPTLVFLGKKGGIYEEKELQRSKMYKEVCE